MRACESKCTREMYFYHDTAARYPCSRSLRSKAMAPNIWALLPRPKQRLNSHDRRHCPLLVVRRFAPCPLPLHHVLSACSGIQATANLAFVCPSRLLWALLPQATTPGLLSEELVSGEKIARRVSLKCRPGEDRGKLAEASAE